MKSVTQSLGKALGKTTTAFTGITDASSAESALPQLGEATELFTGVSESLADAPAIPKAAIAKVAAKNVDKVQAAADKVMSMDGVGDVLKPAVGPLLDALSSIGK